MIKLIKLLILPYTFHLKSTVHLADTIVIIQGKSLNFGQSDYPGTPQDTQGHPRHPRTLRDSTICIFNILYERV